MIRSKHRQDLRGSHDHFICCLYICLGGRHRCGCLFRVKHDVVLSHITMRGTPQTGYLRRKRISRMFTLDTSCPILFQVDRNHPHPCRGNDRHGLGLRVTIHETPRCKFSTTEIRLQSQNGGVSLIADSGRSPGVNV